MEPQQATSALACTLMEEERKARPQLVRGILKGHIQSVETDAREVTIVLSKAIDTSQIEEFVALERQCCAFLTFEIIEQSNVIDLKITGPEGSEVALQMFANGAG